MPRYPQAFCPKCRRNVVQGADLELLNGPIGPTTKAVAVYLRYGLQLLYRKVMQKFFYDQLDSICSRQLADDNAETLRTRLRDPTRLYQRLFTFLKHPQIEPTNNQAEQSLRYMVIFRKICFRTRFSQGSVSHSVLPSLLMTARRQGRHPLRVFETLFASDTATVQADLYNSPC